MAGRLFTAFLRALLIAAWLPSAAAGAAELVMFESAGCPYCARWHREIAPIFAKTDEGRRAPLRRVDVAARRPVDLARIGAIVYTPTFVLVHDGREYGRIVGYSGQEAFWWLLSDLVKRLDRPPPALEEPRAPPGGTPPPGTPVPGTPTQTE